MRRWIGRIGLFLLGLAITVLVMAEIEVRCSGLGDRPLYRADSSIGYIPRPSQNGRFHNRHDWAFNAHSMRTDQPFRPDPAARDVLLIGDSVIFGGHDNASTPGPALARASGTRVWPVAAPSWGLANALTYLEENDDVVRAVDDIVFVVNSADFGPASHWINGFMHPTKRPLSYAAYWLGSQFLMGWRGNEIPVIDRGTLGLRLDRLQRTTRARVLFVYYPTRDEVISGEDCFAVPEAIRRFPGYCLGRDPEWSLAIYKDLVHPRPEASPLLGRAMARALVAVAGQKPADAAKVAGPSATDLSQNSTDSTDN